MKSIQQNTAQLNKMRTLFCLFAFALIFGVLAQSPCNVNGCTYEEATDGGSKPAPITFGDYFYTPKCLRVAAGTVITFEGDLEGHPLLSGAFNSGTFQLDAFNGTIRADTGMSASFNMTIAGANPYVCDYHYQRGMYGVIYVGDSCSSAAPKAPTANPVASPVVAPTSQNPPSATPKASSAIAVQVSALSLFAILAI